MFTFSINTRNCLPIYGNCWGPFPNHFDYSLFSSGKGEDDDKDDDDADNDKQKKEEYYYFFFLHYARHFDLHSSDGFFMFN